MTPGGPLIPAVHESFADCVTSLLVSIDNTITYCPWVLHSPACCPWVGHALIYTVWVILPLHAAPIILTYPAVHKSYTILPAVHGSQTPLPAVCGSYTPLNAKH